MYVQLSVFQKFINDFIISWKLDVLSKGNWQQYIIIGVVLAIKEAF